MVRYTIVLYAEWIEKCISIPKMSNVSMPQLPQNILYICVSKKKYCTFGVDRDIYVSITYFLYYVLCVTHYDVYFVLQLLYT